MRKHKTKTPWWQSPELAPLISRAINAYREFKARVQNGDISKIDLQFEALHHIVVAYNKYRFNNTADQFMCICAILDEGLTTERKQTVIDMLQKIGMEKMRGAFVVLNQVCAESMWEPDNLFSIIKRHRLNQTCPRTGSEMLTRLGYYLNVSMINFNRKRNTGSKDTSEKLLEMKLQASRMIIPILDAVFEALFGRAVIDDEKTLDLFVNLEQ